MSQIEEVRIQPTVYVEVVMPSGVIQVFERPAYAEVAAVGPQGGAGPAGADGADGPPGQSAILGTWEGPWSASVQYPSLGMVQYQGSTYLNSSGFFSPLGVPPSTSPAWELVAAKGEPGPQGASGALFSYIHTQDIASASWIINHNLDGYPNVTAVDSTNREIVGDVLYLSNNQLRIDFSAPNGGKAYIS
jgi:hypothetical protein